jgi:polyisoprenoid-binding protein YceI
MRGLPRIFFGTLMLAVVAAGAAGAGWWFFVREDDKLATNAPAVPTELVNRTVTPAAGGLTFRIIPERSEAAYFADEKLARLPLPSKAKGATNDIEGEFHLTDDGLSLDERAPSTFTVNLRTLKSDEARRDSRVQNDALQTGQFPTATFVATRVTGVDTSVPAGEEHTFQLTGTLDLHGVKKEVTWEVKARRDGNVMTALATVSFEFQDFDITPPNIAGFVSVQDKITLQVSVVAEAVG